MDVPLNARVELHGTKGYVRFVGNTDFATGKWVGIELDEPSGKNNGTVLGKFYFSAQNNHGVFVRPSLVKIIQDDAASTPSQSVAQPAAAVSAKEAETVPESGALKEPSGFARRASIGGKDAAGQTALV
jgi:dynactin 1